MVEEIVDDHKPFQCSFTFITTIIIMLCIIIPQLHMKRYA